MDAEMAHEAIPLFGYFQLSFPFLYMRQEMYALGSREEDGFALDSI